MATTTSRPTASKNSADPRRRRLWILAAVAGLAIAAAVALIALSSDDGGKATPAPAGTAPAGVAETREMLAGIPQDGLVLGDPDAPVTLTEFADLQCPFCKEVAEQVFPLVVRDYVRTGKVKVEFALLAFLGPDSERGARLAAAAAQQDRLWNFVHLFFFNQGAENSGFATDEFLRRLTRAIPGLDGARATADAAGRDATRTLADAKALASRNGVDSTPTFMVRAKGGENSDPVTGVQSYDDLRTHLDSALGR